MSSRPTGRTSSITCGTAPSPCPAPCLCPDPAPSLGRGAVPHARAPAADLARAGCSPLPASDAGSHPRACRSRAARWEKKT